MTLHERTTWVFATAGLDGRAIGSKSILSCIYQGDGILFGYKMYLQQLKQKSATVPA